MYNLATDGGVALPLDFYYLHMIYVSLLMNGVFIWVCSVLNQVF